MARFGIGQAVRRVEDQRFLTGKGRYVEDISLANQAYGVALGSPYAHARIVSIDVSKAATAPGVLAVFTGTDVAADKIGGLTAHPMPEEVGAPAGFRTFQTLLNHERVRFVGDRIAFLVAETLAQARDALDLIEVEYDELPAVSNLDDAAAAGAAKVWDDNQKGNWAFGLMFGDEAKTEAAFKTARHVVKLRVEHNRLAPNAIEPRVAIGDYAQGDDQYTLYVATQNPHGVRTELSHVFHVAESQIRVISPDVGGGFGLKGGPFPEDALVLWASKKLARPVKWVATRTESLLTDRHGREMVMYGEMALDDQGKILGLRCKSLYQVGAYFVGPGLVPAAFSQRFMPEAYDIKNLHVAVQGLFTNTSPVGPYRGAGRPEAAYFTERMIEHAARQIGMEPDEIRRRNLIPESALPYTTPTFWVYDSGEFHRIMQKCQDVSDWTGFAARRKTSESTGKLRGRAVTFYIEQGGIFNERMDLRFDPSGSVTIIAGTHSHGQGHATVFAQLVHEWLGVPFETIRYIQGDTGQVPIGRGTYAARSSLVGGNALKVASEAIIDRAKPMAAALMEAAEADLEFKDGEFRVVGTDKTMPLTEVAKAFYAPMGPLTEKMGIGLEASGNYNTNPPNHPNGSHVCELEIDPETGSVVIDRYYVVDDLGRVLNPMIVRGQIHGGVAQGAGQALVEHAIYDRESSQMLSASFMDYGMPHADLLPDIESHLEEIPAKTNPLGVKGIGESGTIGAPPTIINAILDALKPLGVDLIDMPATPPRVWEAIQRAKKAGVGKAA